MKITAEKFNDYIQQFVKGYLIQEARQTMTKFKLGFALGTGKLAVDAQMIEAAKAVGVADADGNIDVDALKKATNSGMDMAGELQFQMLGIKLNRAETDKFFQLVETGALS